MRCFNPIVAATAGLALASSGCSVIGLAIGSTYPDYSKQTTLDRLEAERGAESPSKGADLRVTVRDCNDDLDVLGAYTGQSNGELRLLTSRGGARIRTDAIRRIDERTGSNWLLGLAIGGAIDIALVVVSAVALSNAKFIGTIDSINPDVKH